MLRVTERTEPDSSGRGSLWKARSVVSRSWEYCSLVSHGVETEEGEIGWLCRITYFTSDGAKTVQLKEPTSDQPPDVFERAMAQLGAGGWELVSLQHPLVSDRVHLQTGQVAADVTVGFSFSSFGVAYFKRRAKGDRLIDDPAVVIQEG